MSPARTRQALILPLLILTACSRAEDESAPGPPVEPRGGWDQNIALVGEVLVSAPTEPIADMGIVEDFSEAVANRFVAFADKLRRRDFTAARDFVAADFMGDSFSGLPVAQEEELPLGATRLVYDTGRPTVCLRTEFLASLAAWLSRWERVESVVWKVKAAEFQIGFPAWGKIRTRISLSGSDAGAPRSVTAWAEARVEQVQGAWMLKSFELSSLELLARDAPLFTDVSTSAGLAHTGIRFGRAGNQNFAWNGAAGGDVDGDGLWDLFVPSTPKNFLYLGRSSAAGDDRSPPFASFVDEAAARGVAEPAGGTGAVFFDFDNDGDQDLALAGVGWQGGGDALRLWRNDGSGSFTEVGEELGFGDRCHGYSLVAFDAEGDGWVDLFVCNYGRLEEEPNDSWIQATNGTPNRYYRNQEGQGFVECAGERGFQDRAWSYAAAAADFDRDGDQDLYVANDYGRNQLWINDGRGHFEEAAKELGVEDLGNGMGVAWGDLDTDGRLDLYVANMSSTAGNRILARLEKQDDTWKALKKLAAGNTIFLGDAGGERSFARAPAAIGGIGGSWAWSPTLLDIDLDGRLDVYCCSGFVTGNTPEDT